MTHKQLVMKRGYATNRSYPCRCASGLMGTRSRLQTIYANFSEFEQYDSIYGIASRLGFATALIAWDRNPVVESSTNPDDLRVVT